MNTVFLGENVIQIAKMQSSVATNLHFLSISCHNRAQKRKFLATLNSFRRMHSDRTTRRMQKSVDSSLLGRSDWNNNNPEISENMQNEANSIKPRENKNNTERKIIQNNYIICETKWKIIYTKPFYGKQQPHTHNYKRRGRTHKI